MDKTDRLKEAFTHLRNNGIVHTQKEVAMRMGSTPPNVSSAFKGDPKYITDSFLRRFNDAFGDVFNENWLLAGEGNMLNDEDVKEPVAKTAMEKISEYSVPEGSNEGIPLIPINAMAGALTGEVSVMEFECERYYIPIFRGADFLIQVSGDSMMPTYYSGDIVACKRVPLRDLFFQWNKTYVLDTEQGALIKRIKPGSDKDHIQIVSDNEDYPPFELSTDQFYGVAIVCGLIRSE